jgi:lysophospholipase L1-like esterase
VPSSRSASPISHGSEPPPVAAGEPRVAHPALALAVKLALTPLLVTQALRTRRRAPVLPEAAGARDGRAGQGDGPPLRILVAGDSSAAGVGVAHQDQAVIGHLIRTLAAQRPGSIEWRLRARTGLSTRGVHQLLQAEPPPPAEVAVVVTGVNDVIEQIPVALALGHRRALADWLLGTGLAGHVVFAPLPPMHQFPLLPEPLRRVLGGDARRHDLALARWAATRDDVSVAMIALALTPESMASDGFHPGEPVYRACGEALGLHIARRRWSDRRA